MKLECKDGYEITGFQISNIVKIACGSMNTLMDFNNRDGYYTHKRFAELVFEVLSDKLRLSKKLKLRHLRDPKQFIESCKYNFHLRKQKDLNLRSFQTKGDGWVFIRYNRDTNPNDIEKLDRQARDRIASRSIMHNERVSHDQRELGISSRLKLPDPKRDVLKLEGRK